MIIVDIEQGHDEWLDLRAGIPTASVFDQIITSQGMPSKSQQKLIYRLAGERILGHKELTYSNAAMERGIELEGEARDCFKLITGLDIVEVGLCYKDDDEKIACSPDGLIGKHWEFAREGLEIKCPSLAVHVEYLIKGKLPTTYFQQIQGSMFVTDCEKWHFFSYHPGMKPLHIIVERDEIWIAKFSKIIDDFCMELDEVHKSLLEK